MLLKLTPLVNFSNILLAKKHNCLLALLGSALVNAACKHVVEIDPRGMYFASRQE